jgi:hypothetical protein
VTDRQILVFENVQLATRKGRWYRAAGQGERVTLAFLYRSGKLIRRVRDGKEDDASAAHEYQITPSTP